MVAQTLALFPTQVYVSEISLSRQVLREIERDLRDLRQRDRLGQDWSREKYYAGYTSYGSASDLHHRYPSFAEICRHIDREKNRFVKRLHWQANPAAIEMSTCWINMMKRGSHHGLHIHPLSVLSGTLFIKTPRACGKFKIQDPRMTAFMARPLVRSNSPFQTTEEIEVFPGRLILFESWLNHEVPVNRATEERVSLSFNYHWNP